MKARNITPSRRQDDGNAFIPESGRVRADDAESFAEEFVASITSGEGVGDVANDEVVDDEQGGPFFVLNDDGSLPKKDEMKDGDHEAHDSVVRQATGRAARWVGRGN